MYLSNTKTQKHHIIENTKTIQNFYFKFPVSIDWVRQKNGQLIESVVAWQAEAHAQLVGSGCAKTKITLVSRAMLGQRA